MKKKYVMRIKSALNILIYINDIAIFYWKLNNIL